MIKHPQMNKRAAEPTPAGAVRALPGLQQEGRASPHQRREHPAGRANARGRLGQHGKRDRGHAYPRGRLTTEGTAPLP